MGAAQPPLCMAVLASAARAGAVGPSHKGQLGSNSVSDLGRLLQWQWGHPTAWLGLGPLRMRSSWGVRLGALLGVRENLVLRKAKKRNRLGESKKVERAGA